MFCKARLISLYKTKFALTPAPLPKWERGAEVRNNAKEESV
jgi:hypothetical protein